MISLYWFKEILNIGDYLNIFLLNKLTNDSIKYVDPNTRLPLLFKRIIKKLLGKKVKYLFEDYLYPWNDCYFCIGSILNRANSKTIVWGSGCREYNDKVATKKIKAVRGYLTLDVLRKNGIDTSNIKVGDPALLLPKFYNPQNKRKLYKISIIPHYKDFDVFSYINKSYHIINVSTNDVEKFVDEICASEYILSSSLHGLILAHAYGIPALWIKYNDVRSSEFKYLDYFSSVKIPAYLGFEDIYNLFNSEHYVSDLFKKNRELSLPNTCIKDIEKDLLEVCPFIKI